MSAGTGEEQAASAPRAVRQHTGRRRNAAARDAILDVTIELLRTRGTTGLTIDAIAEAAGVGRQTIYRWWPSKGAVAVPPAHRPCPAGPARGPRPGRTPTRGRRRGPGWRGAGE